MQTLIAPDTTSAAEQFDAHSPNFTRDRFALMAQMRADAPVTFVPSMGLYAVTRWQDVRDVLGDAAMFASSGRLAVACIWRRKRRQFFRFRRRFLR